MFQNNEEIIKIMSVNLHRSSSHTVADLRNLIGKITNTDWGGLGNSIIDFLNDVYNFVLFKGRRSPYP